MTIHQAYRQLVASLYELYNDREAANIADWVIEHITGQTKIDRIVYKDLGITLQQQEQLQHTTNELLQHKPVQYVLHESWFDELKFYVDEHVLIPRPETEELVAWIASDVKSGGQNADKGTGCAILDIGTGSGCIAVALKKRLPEANVFAIDISPEALDVAKRNAKAQNTAINCLQLDVLNPEEWKHLESFDIIVSNPPYVKLSEKNLMNKNVVEYEPHTALFVPDENSLIFYKALAELGTTHLHQNGLIYAEINESLGKDVMNIFTDSDYRNIQIKKDMQGKNRMVKAQNTIADFEM